MASSVRCVFVLLLAIPACAIGSKYGDFECDPATDRTCDSSHQTAAADAGHPHDAATHYDSASVYDAAEPLDSASIDAGARDSAITQQCALGLSTGMPACDTCLGAHCCTEDNACANGRDCTSYIQCGNDCFAVDGGYDANVLRSMRDAVPERQCADERAHELHVGVVQQRVQWAVSFRLR